MVFFFLGTLPNRNEDLRAKPSTWNNVGWMPIIDEGKCCRPGQGYDSDAARNVRVHQECWRNFLRPFIQNTNFSVILFSDNMQDKYAMGLELQ